MGSFHNSRGRESCAVPLRLARITRVREGRIPLLDVLRLRETIYKPSHARFVSFMTATGCRSPEMLSDFEDRRGCALEALHGAYYARGDPDNWAAMTCGVQRFEGFQDAWA
jgi:hypothetical protein